MSDTFSADEIYILDLAEDQTPSDFRGEPSRKWPGVTRRLRPTAIKVSELAASVKLFMQQMETLLADTPSQLGEFEFAEFEVSAGIAAGGKLTLLGVGSTEAGAEGSLKFVFKKRAAQS